MIIKLQSGGNSLHQIQRMDSRGQYTLTWTSHNAMHISTFQKSLSPLV